MATSARFFSKIIVSGLVAALVSCGGDYGDKTITKESKPGYFHVKIEGGNYFSFRVQRNYYGDRIDCDLEVYSPADSLHFLDLRCDDKVDEFINHGRPSFRVERGEQQFAEINSLYAKYKVIIGEAAQIDLDRIVKEL